MIFLSMLNFLPTLPPLACNIANEEEQNSMKPVYKTTDTALYNEDCMKIMA